MVVVGVVAASASTAFAQSPHYTCYRARTSDGAPSFQRIDGVTLEDREHGATARVTRPLHLCLPTSKNGEDPAAPDDPEHLADYRLVGADRFAVRRRQMVDDQFGTLVVDLRRPVSLMVPTAKDLASTPGPLVDPEVGHYQCYRAKRSRGEVKFGAVSGVTLEDQFGGLVVDVRRPRRVCHPVDKNGEDPGAPGRPGSLVCYKVRQTDRPRFQARRGVFTSNQFGDERIDAVKPRELCLPAVVNCGDGVIGPGEQCDGSNAPACRGACQADCQCPSCGPPGELCVSNDCGSSTPVVTIPNAENILFTDTDRLFVSGGTNVFEITSDGTGGYDATPLSATDCNFTGLAQIGATLYANCFAGNLYAATLDAAPSLSAIHALGLGGPNGMTVAGGKLYIVNGPTAGDPKIVRVTLDATDPLQVVEQIDWFTGSLQFPNGIEFDGTDFYLTDSNLAGDPGSVRRLTIDPDGSPGTLTTVWAASGILDDLSVGPDFILAAGFQNGDVTLLDKAGTVLQSTSPATFESPSAVRGGQLPLFLPTDVLVTEKGLLTDPTGPIGNVLSLFRRDCP